MGTYITAATVRRTCGIKVAEISDDDVDATISEVEKEVPRFFNTVFVPTEKIDILDGDGTNRLLLDQNPVLSVRELKIDTVTEDPVNLEIYKDSGYIFLGETADTSKFSKKRNSCIVRYLYGTVEHSLTVLTTSSDAEVAGTSVSVAVADESSFTALDWVEIYGMDGNREVAQVSSTSTGILVLDQLIQTHVSGSKIVKMIVSENFTKIMNIIASISLVARIVGQSYSDIVGYDLGEFHVQKGEPYTQWRETANQFIKVRDEILIRISIRPRVTA